MKATRPVGMAAKMSAGQRDRAQQQPVAEQVAPLLDEDGPRERQPHAASSLGDRPLVADAGLADQLQVDLLERGRLLAHAVIRAPAPTSAATRSGVSRPGSSSSTTRAPSRAWAPCT